MTSMARDIPDSVLDEAFAWAVVLNSGNVDHRQRSEFERWLQAPQNRMAWQRIEIIDKQFAAARSAGTHGLQALDRASVRRRRGKLKTLAGSVLLLPLTVFLLLPSWQAQHMTARNELKTLTLAGGTRVFLDADTSLDVARANGAAVLQLHRGRIMVDSSAAQAADKPQVAAGHGHFTPVGTRFVVSTSADQTDLAVLQGRVRARPDSDGLTGKPIEARAGERLRVTARGIESVTDDGLQPGSWTDGVIEADNARLDDVLAALGRYHRGWLRCDAAIASLRVTGVFHVDDIDGALHALQQSLPVQITRNTDWWLRVQAKVQ